ncbi:hypothetical protein MKZ38_010016 [Zalerion maritima]|uniref:CFEM domain-containing protein n=1 Tax=Zalerion maritima TaxID=339359 RepID=A0AAD5RSQ3_9PEZI|nr:hypothetical protein MKZ38_010016 [Zalerion maritima]
MRASFILAAAGFAAAQVDLSGVPECAQTCIANGLQELGCADETCACDPDIQADLTTAISPCMLDACSAEELAQALSAAETMCANVSTTATATVTAIDTVTDETGTILPTSSTSNGTIVTSTPTATSSDNDAEETGDSSDNSDGVDESGAIRGPAVGLLALAFGILAAL